MNILTNIIKKTENNQISELEFVEKNKEPESKTKYYNSIIGDPSL